MAHSLILILGSPPFFFQKFFDNRKKKEVAAIRVTLLCLCEYKPKKKKKTVRIDRLGAIKVIGCEGGGGLYSRKKWGIGVVYIFLWHLLLWED